MTISSSDNISGPYTGTGSVATYDIDFYFDADADLLVTQEDTSGNITTLALTTDYTVVGAASASPPRNITLVAGNLTTGYKLSITRNVEALQNVDLGEGDDFPSALVEGALDKLTMIAQQLEEIQGRTIVLAATSSGVSTTVPAPQADYTLGWNALGTALTNIAPADDSAAAAAASAAAAAASAASINLPTISASDENSTLEVNSAGSGYDLITEQERVIRYSVFNDAFL